METEKNFTTKDLSGARGRNRTTDTRIFNPLLGVGVLGDGSGGVQRVFRKNTAACANFSAGPRGTGAAH